MAREERTGLPALCCVPRASAHRQVRVVGQPLFARARAPRDLHGHQLQRRVYFCAQAGQHAGRERRWRARSVSRRNTQHTHTAGDCIRGKCATHRPARTAARARRRAPPARRAARCAAGRGAPRSAARTPRTARARPTRARRCRQPRHPPWRLREAPRRAGATARAQRGRKRRRTWRITHTGEGGGEKMESARAAHECAAGRAAAAARGAR